MFLVSKISQTHEILNTPQLQLVNMSQEELGQYARDVTTQFSSEFLQRISTTYYFTKNELDAKINKVLDKLPVPESVKQAPLNKGMIAFIVSVAAGGGVGVFTAEKCTKLLAPFMPHPHAQKGLEHIAASTGAIVGGGGGALVFLLKGVENTPSFSHWKGEKKSEALTHYINVKYSDDILLKEFICPYTGLIIEKPGKVNGKYVEYDATQKVEDAYKKEGKIQDPFRINDFYPHEVHYDPGAAVALHKRIVYLLKEDARSNKADSSYVIPLEIMIEDAQKKVAHHFELCEQYIASLKKDDRIPYEVYKAEQNKADTCCGRTPTCDLEWDKVLSQLQFASSEKASSIK